MEIAKLEAIISGDIKPLQVALKEGERSLEHFAQEGADAFLSLNAGLSKTAQEALAAATDINGLKNAMNVLEQEQAGIIRGTTLWRLYETELKKVDAQLETTILLEKQFEQQAKKTGASTTASISGIGKGLGGMFSQLKSIAYILPGIGIAGIFNLAFEAIGKAADELGIFKDKTKEEEDAVKKLEDAFQALENEIKKVNDELGITPTAAEGVASALSQIQSSLQDIQNTFKDLNTEPAFITFFKGGFEGLAFRNDLLKKQAALLEQEKRGITDLNDFRIASEQQLMIDLGQVNATMLQHNLELQKQANNAIVSNTKTSYSARFAALKNILSEEFQINKIAYDKAIASTQGNEAKKAAIEETYRFANLKAEQDYANDLLRLRQKQSDDAVRAAQELAKEEAKAMAEAMKRVKELRPRFMDWVDPADLSKLNEVLDKVAAIKVEPVSTGVFERLNIKNLEKFNAQLKTMKDVASEIAGVFADMFTEFITKGRISFDQLAKSVERLISKLIEAVLQTFLLQAITAALTGGTSAAGFGLANFLKSGIHFADGGIITSPTTFGNASFAENGPEAVIPLDRLQNMVSGLGQNNLHITGELRAHGTDLVVALNRGNVRINRNYGSNFSN